MPASRASPLATPAALAFLLAGLAFLVLRARFDLYDADELQHAHLAWLVAAGKVPYRDFWDNHGPLFTLANGALLALSGAAPGMALLEACRWGALAAAAGILACTVGIARRLALPLPVALAAAGTAAALLFLQDKAAECRPDGWQNLFWLGGLLVLLRPAPRGIAMTVGAGALFGLAVLTNVKAGLGPFWVAAWYLLAGRLHGLAPRAVAGELAGLAAGAVAVYLPFLAWFATRGAAWAMHDYSALWNFLYVDEHTFQSLSRANVGFLLTQQLPFVIAFAAGVVAWVADLRDPAGVLPKAGGSLLLVAALGTGLSLGLNLYYQFFLIFLPLWAVVAAFGLWRAGAWLAARAGSAGRVATALLVAAGAAALLATSLRLTPREPRPELAFQQAFTKMLMAATPRSEPVGVIWDVCGGFMFNEPLQFYWGAEADIGATARRHGGRDPFAEDFVAALEARQVRFVVGRDDRVFPFLPEATQRYLREHYRYSNCLWTRRRAPAQGAAP